MQRRFCLRRDADFERVRQQGQTWRHPLVILGAAPNDLAHNRYGFVTSRRLGGAVVRNRVRRLLREAARLSAPQLRPGFDIVIIARNEIVAQPYYKVNSALMELFQRARLLSQERQP